MTEITPGMTGTVGDAKARVKAVWPDTLDVVFLSSTHYRWLCEIARADFHPDPPPEPPKALSGRMYTRAYSRPSVDQPIFGVGLADGRIYDTWLGAKATFDPTIWTLVEQEKP